MTTNAQKLEWMVESVNTDTNTLRKVWAAIIKTGAVDKNYMMYAFKNANKSPSAALARVIRDVKHTYATFTKIGHNRVMGSIESAAFDFDGFESWSISVLEAAK